MLKNFCSISNSAVFLQDSWSFLPAKLSHRMANMECAVCGAETAFGELLEHIHTQHIGLYRNNYSCGHCSFLSTDANTLILHADEKRHLPLQMKVLAREYVNDLAEKIMRDSLEFMSGRGVKRKLDETGGPTSQSLEAICQLCQCNVPKKESCFLQHITHFHWDAPLICPYCTHFEGDTWFKLTKHIRKKHQSKVESFGLTDMEDASQLREKVQECFKKKPKSAKKTPPQQDEVQSAFESQHHLCSADQSDGTTYKMFRQCFPEQEAEKCALCHKVIQSRTGRAFHSAVFHYQKPITCPQCSHTELHSWNMNKHLKETHPKIKYTCFQPPADWTKGLQESTLLCFPRRKPTSAFVQSSLVEEWESTPVQEIAPQESALTEQSPQPQQLPLVVPPSTPTGRPQLDRLPVRSEKSSLRSSVPQSSGRNERRVCCQLCHQPMLSFQSLEKHVWVTHLDQKRPTFRCSCCGVQSHSVKFFRHGDQCPAENVSPCVVYKMRSMFIKRFFSCFPWPFIRDIFKVSFRDVAAPPKEEILINFSY